MTLVVVYLHIEAAVRFVLVGIFDRELDTEIGRCRIVVVDRFKKIERIRGVITVGIGDNDGKNRFFVGASGIDQTRQRMSIGTDSIGEGFALRRDSLSEQASRGAVRVRRIVGEIGIEAVGLFAYLQTARRLHRISGISRMRTVGQTRFEHFTVLGRTDTRDIVGYRHIELRRRRVSVPIGRFILQRYDDRVLIRTGSRRGVIDRSEQCKFISRIVYRSRHFGGENDITTCRTGQRLRSVVPTVIDRDTVGSQGTATGRRKLYFLHRVRTAGDAEVSAHYIALCTIASDVGDIVFVDRRVHVGGRGIGTVRHTDLLMPPYRFVSIAIDKLVSETSLP